MLYMFIFIRDVGNRYNVVFLRFSISYCISPVVLSDVRLCLVFQ